MSIVNLAGGAAFFFGKDGGAAVVVAAGFSGSVGAAVSFFGSAGGGAVVVGVYLFSFLGNGGRVAAEVTGTGLIGVELSKNFENGSSFEATEFDFEGKGGGADEVELFEAPT